MTHIVARISSRMLGGPGLSRNKEWIETTLGYAHDAFDGAQALKRYPEFLKPLAARFTPAIQNIKKHYQTAERAVVPLLQARRDRERATGEKVEADDFLGWMSDEAKGKERDDVFQAGILLNVSFASIHTSAGVPSNLLFDLCARPEYVEPLRAEIAALSVEGQDGDYLTRQAFQNMSKLDSIMKESQRFNPHLLVTFERVITRDYRLSDGLVIPANTMIGVPAHAIAMDPELFPRPNEYDGFRFDDHTLRQRREEAADTDQLGAKQTEKSKSAASVAWVAVHPSSLAFGYGRHACPGRFFTAAEVKALMAYILRNFDFKFPDGKTDRPPNLVFETQNLPDPAVRILFKRRA
jgi:cytochrome P450